MGWSSANAQSIDSSKFEVEILKLFPPVPNDTFLLYSDESKSYSDTTNSPFKGVEIPQRFHAFLSLSNLTLYHTENTVYSCYQFPIDEHHTGLICRDYHGEVYAYELFVLVWNHTTHRFAGDHQVAESAGTMDAGSWEIATWLITNTNQPPQYYSYQHSCHSDSDMESEPTEDDCHSTFSHSYIKGPDQLDSGRKEEHTTNIINYLLSAFPLY
jgi:hypothetical protein